MFDWIRFAFIVFVVALDDVLQELMTSFTTTRDVLRYRVKSIVQGKLRPVWRRRKTVDARSRPRLGRALRRSPRYLVWPCDRLGKAPRQTSVVLLCIRDC